MPASRLGSSLPATGPRPRGSPRVGGRDPTPPRPPRRNRYTSLQPPLPWMVLRRHLGPPRRFLLRLPLLFPFQLPRLLPCLPRRTRLLPTFRSRSGWCPRRWRPWKLQPPVVIVLAPDAAVAAVGRAVRSRAGGPAAPPHPRLGASFATRPQSSKLTTAIPARWRRIFSRRFATPFPFPRPSPIWRRVAFPTGLFPVPS